MVKFLKKLWQRLEHIVLDFCVISAIIIGVSLISEGLHYAAISKERIEILESVHFWMSIILILMFSFFTLLILGKGMWEEFTKKGEDNVDD